VKKRLELVGAAKHRDAPRMAIGHRARSVEAAYLGKITLRDLKRESCGKLQHAGKAVWADFLQGSEIART
jgi:hypothetical protein